MAYTRTKTRAFTVDTPQFKVIVSQYPFDPLSSINPSKGGHKRRLAFLLRCGVLVGESLGVQTG